MFFYRNDRCLRVVRLTVLDQHPFLVDRVDGLLDRLARDYRLAVEYAGTYRGLCFSQAVVFEHPDGMFKVVEWGDLDGPAKMQAAEVIRHPNCQFVLKCQYDPAHHCPRLRPFFYFEKNDPVKFSALLPRLRSLAKARPEVYWRGNPHMGRAGVVAQVRDLLQPDADRMVPTHVYYEELARHRVALSLPGMGNSCHREFEAFAVGTPVLAPRFKNTYHVPLVPDHHYLSVPPCEPDRLGRAIRDRLARTTEAELAAVRRNAMAYYDAHIRYEASLTWFRHLLEL